jgi:hypothetical protein
MGDMEQRIAALKPWTEDGAPNLGNYYAAVDRLALARECDCGLLHIATSAEKWRMDPIARPTANVAATPCSPHWRGRNE